MVKRLFKFKGAIFGPPGSGKGTISNKIIDTFDIVHVSAGDIFRKHISDGSDFGASVKKYLEDGKLVPDVLVLKIFMERLDELKHKHVLCDGFPRTLVQAEKLFMKYPLDMVIHLKVPVEEILKRLTGRLVHIPSGRVYNLEFKPPKKAGVDDVTGEPLTQRADDKLEVVKQRLEVFLNSSTPLLDFYKKKGILREFSGTKSEQLWIPIKASLEKFMKPKQ